MCVDLLYCDSHCWLAGLGWRGDVHGCDFGIASRLRLPHSYSWCTCTWHLALASSSKQLPPQRCRHRSLCRPKLHFRQLRTASRWCRLMFFYLTGTMAGGCTRCVLYFEALVRVLDPSDRSTGKSRHPSVLAATWLTYNLLL